MNSVSYPLSYTWISAPLMVFLMIKCKENCFVSKKPMHLLYHESPKMSAFSTVLELISRHYLLGLSCDEPGKKTSCLFTFNFQFMGKPGFFIRIARKQVTDKNKSNYSVTPNYIFFNRFSVFSRFPYNLSNCFSLSIVQSSDSINLSHCYHLLLSSLLFFG